MFRAHLLTQCTWYLPPSEITTKNIFESLSAKWLNLLDMAPILRLTTRIITNLYIQVASTNIWPPPKNGPKGFGIEFLLIHRLFLPQLPLLHQFHHKMPKIQNRQKNNLMASLTGDFSMLIERSKNAKTTNSQTDKTWNKLIHFLPNVTFPWKWFQAASANTFKGWVSCLSKNTRLMRLCDACVGTARGVST